jgi:hypothetical protein
MSRRKVSQAGRPKVNSRRDRRRRELRELEAELITRASANPYDGAMLALVRAMLAQT